MREHWVIPDIHGCAKTLRALIEDLIQPSKHDWLYFLGDYIDRGPSSKEVIDYLIYLQKEEYNIRTLLGNHEDYLVKSYEEELSLKKVFGIKQKNKKKKEWLFHGGKETMERVREGYDLMVHGKGKKTSDILQSIQESYDDGVTDEFIKPIVVVGDDNQPLSTIKDNDVVICFNFRTDRLRQITTALTQQDFPEYGMKTLDLQYYTLTNYDDSFKDIHVLYDKENVHNTLGELMAKAGKKQIRIAETEKYAHVTFFFSGGREEEFKNEKRIMIPSPKVATYDLQPEMSAYKVKDAIVEELKKQETDFICLNFANGDMVGHTGVYESILKAVEAVDSCVKDVVEAARPNGYDVLIIADHGNADNAINPDGSPNTAHSLNPVPCILVSDKKSQLKNGILADVAPTILNIMGMNIPEDMTGNVLVS